MPPFAFPWQCQVRIWTNVVSTGNPEYTNKCNMPSWRLSIWTNAVIFSNTEIWRRTCHLWLVGIVDQGSLVSIKDKPTPEKKGFWLFLSIPIFLIAPSELQNYHHHHHHHHYHPRWGFLTYSILSDEFPVCSNNLGNCSCWSRCACTTQSEKRFKFNKSWINLNVN